MTIVKFTKDTSLICGREYQYEETTFILIWTKDGKLIPI